MLPPLKPGVTLPRSNGPIIETGRLILRQWRGADVVPNTAMLADPVVIVIESPAVILRLFVIDSASSFPILVVRPPVTDRLSSAPTLIDAASPTETDCFPPAETVRSAATLID